MRGTGANGLTPSPPLAESRGCFDEAEAQAFNEQVTNVPSAVLSATTARVINAVATGDESSWQRAATGLARGAGNGMGPDKAAEVVRAGYDAYEGAVANAVADQIGGLSVEARSAFYTWAQSNAKSELPSALAKLVYSRDLSGFRALAARYARSRSNGST